ncbi:MAG: DUF3488 domain-containing transglutaminase family protein [Proteobacteria bacterium]|nr:DUF3488 domain-containing transglutaminase family protein [Pseudomonadota bacterium]
MTQPWLRMPSRWSRTLGAEQIAATAAIAVLLLGVALHATSLPVWTLVAVLGCAVWRFLAVLNVVPLPGTSRTIRVAFLFATTLALLAVLASFRTLNGLAAGTALLSMMGALKLLETRTPRDERVVVGVALFLLLAACLADQSLTRTPFYLLHAWVSCAALALIAQRSSSVTPRVALRLAGRALLAAVPVAIVFFLFFPRVAGQFWALPTGGTATTGLSDEMTPGSIDRLIEHYEPAFRVRFESAVPPPAARYWRGPVLTSFDGYTWRRSRFAQYRDAPIERLGTPVRQRITLEPHHRQWWFALDTVAATPRQDVFLTGDHQLVSLEPVDETVSYTVESHLQTRATEPLSTLGRRLLTALPGSRNPRSRRFAAELRATVTDERAFVSAMLEYFRTQGFQYSLEPPRTSADSVDDFLFDSKLGFCGHFASAFATVMRAGGVPARVVTGYLGGEWNPIGSYLIVRQSDAHAWTEVWLDGAGWTRVDPTGVVEPERLNRGLIDLLPNALSAQTRFLHRSPWLARMLMSWDNVNHWWRESMVEFDFRQQLTLLQKMGLGATGWRGLAMLLAAGFIIWLLWIAYSLRHLMIRSRPDRLAQIWQSFCAHAAPLAGPRLAHETALAFAARVRSARPDLANSALDIAQHYSRLRYGQSAIEPTTSQRALQELDRAVREFAVELTRQPA